jgi:hypothetical protein
MSSAWHRLAENRINEAIERGEFSDVPAGRTLDLSEYFSLPEEDRMVVSMLRNAQFRPPEIDLLKEAAELEEKLTRTSDPVERHRVTEELQARRVAFSLAMERRRKARGEA